MGITRQLLPPSWVEAGDNDPQRGPAGGEGQLKKGEEQQF